MVSDGRDRNMQTLTYTPDRLADTKRFRCLIARHQPNDFIQLGAIVTLHEKA